MARGRSPPPDDLIAQGAVYGDLQASGRWFHGGRMLRQAPSGLMGLAVSRPLLEAYLREAVRAWPQVSIHEDTSVLDLVFDDLGRVTGVRLATVIDGTDGGVLSADLVVDASGRTSRLPAWLERRGFAAPEEEKVRVDVSYATRIFRRRPDDLDGEVVMVYAASPAYPTAAALVAQEGDRWTASVCGYDGQRPPTDLEGFLAFASRLDDPTMVDLLRSCEPLDEGATYRFTANLRRRYEKLNRFPEGLLVTGDALCSFDPVYGQGMATAALEALELRRCLARGPEGLALRFFRAASRIIDIPWSIAVGGDLDLPGTVGKRTLQTRMTHAYVRALVHAGHRDAVLAGAFLHVANLKARPESLLAPRLLARVIRSKAAVRRPAVEGAAGLASSAA